MHVVMASRRTFQYCGHCEQSVSLKTFKEHQRLYFYDGRWIKQRDMRSEGARSRSSSPLTISDPPTPIITNFSDIEEDAESTACNSLLAAEVSVDFEDELEVPTTDSDNEASSASTEAVKSEEIEYWQESESEVKSFLDDTDGPELPATLSPAKAEKTPTQQMEDETVLWIVLFTCVFQALHNLPHRATKWLLMFIGSLLVYLGKFSLPIQRIAASFPGTLYLRGQYLDEKVSNPTIIKHVVCSSCHTLYTMPKCSKTTASAQIKVCDKCSGQKPLFKKVVTGSKWIRLYPRLLFPACSLISSLGVLLASPGFADLCEEWRLGHATNSDQLNDVFNGKVWNEFLDDKGRLFFSEEFTIGLMLNVDWFNPFVHWSNLSFYIKLT